jgi:polysaccharide export outer membrane protein
VTGAVAQPGVLYLEGASSTVLEMIARAGGLTEEAGDELVLTRRRTPGPPAGAGAQDSAGPGQSVEKVVIDLKELIDEGHLLLNLPVGEGCVLTVPARVPKLVYVAGHVSHPGVYEIKEGVRIDALRAVAFGGGMTWTARPANCFVVRQIEDGQRVIAVDLSKSGAERPPFYLQPGDTLVVGSSAGARFVAALRRVLNLGLSAGAF